MIYYIQYSISLVLYYLSPNICQIYWFLLVKYLSMKQRGFKKRILLSEKYNTTPVLEIYLFISMGKDFLVYFLNMLLSGKGDKVGLDHNISMAVTAIIIQ